MPHGNFAPMLNLGFVIEGKQAATMSQERKAQGTTTGPIEKTTQQLHVPPSNPLYKTTPIDTRKNISVSESLHIRRMNVKNESVCSSTNKREETASVSVTPTYRSTARITLQRSQQQLVSNGPAVQAVPGMNITSYISASSVKPSSTVTPSVKSIPTSMSSVTLTPSVKLTRASMAGVRLQPTRTPDSKVPLTSTPNMKLVPTLTPNVKLSPTQTPNVKLSPAPTPNVKMAPTTSANVKFGSISTPNVKLSPTPTPNVNLSPTPTPNVKMAPTSPNMKFWSTSTPNVKLTPTTTTLVTNSINSLTLAPTITLSPTVTLPASYSPNAKIPSNPFHFSKPGKTYGISAPMAPSMAPTSHKMPQNVTWAPISVNPAPYMTPPDSSTNDETEKVVPRRASTSSTEAVTLAPVFAGNRPFVNLTTPTSTTGINQGHRKHSSDGESELYKPSMSNGENHSTRGVIGKQTSPEEGRASGGGSYSAGANYSTQGIISSQLHRGRSSQHSPVRVPSGEGIVNQTDDENGEEAALRVKGHQMSVVERGTPTPTRESTKGFVIRECQQSRQASPNVTATFMPSRSTSPVKMPVISPPIKMTSTHALNMSANVVNLDIEDVGVEGEDVTQRTVSESTKRLLDRWQVSANSLPVKPPTTVTLLELGDQTNTHRFMGSPSLPCLNVHPPLGTPRQPDNSGRRSRRQDTPLTSSICLGPDMAKSATPEQDLMGSARDMASSYHVRMDYGKNLERIWYQKMVEEETKRSAVRKLRKLVDVYKLDGSTDEFYQSFYRSLSDDEINMDNSDDSDDVSIDLNNQNAADRSKVKSPFIRYASTDVLYSDQDDSSCSDIDIVIKDDDLHARRVKHKMRRKRKQREIKYQCLFGDDKENKFQKHLDENGDEIFLPDTEIRALRLNLKKTFDDNLPYDEECTIEQLREQVMKTLARINGTKKKKSSKKKKKKESDENFGYGEYKHKSLYERFLHEYGYLLANYQVEPLSESESSDTEEQVAEQNAPTPLAKSATLPPIAMSKSPGLKNIQYESRKMNKHNVHLPKLNYSYQSSPFSQAGMLIGDTYYTGCYPTSPNSRCENAQNQNNLTVSPRKRKKQRLGVFLKGLTLDRLELRERSEPHKAVVAPLSARRMSDPGVYMGQMLVKQKIIQTDLDVHSISAKGKEKIRKKKKKGSKSKNTKDKPVDMEDPPKKPPRPQSGKCGPQYMDAEFVGCKSLRRRGSARTFQITKDTSITLRELTKDLDFPSKEIKLQVAERRLRRQQQNRVRYRRRQEQEAEDDAFRQRRRDIIAAAKAEFLLQLEIARAKAKKDQGYHTEDGSEDEGIADDGPRRSGKRGSSRSRKKHVLPFPPPDYRELLNTPVVTSGVSWGKVDVPRLYLSQGEIEEEAEDVSDLFLQMKDCRWIRWTKTQQRILDHVNQLEMDLL